MQAIKFNAVHGRRAGEVRKCSPQIKTGHLIKPKGCEERDSGERVLSALIYTGRHV